MQSSIRIGERPKEREWKQFAEMVRKPLSGLRKRTESLLVLWHMNCTSRSKQGKSNCSQFTLTIKTSE